MPDTNEKTVPSEPVINTGPTTSGVCRVAFKAPAFWHSDAQIWFAQIESQFIFAGITQDSTKFHAVVAALDAKVLNCVRDIILNPPATEAYPALKSRILSFYDQSESAKLNKLLTDLQLGDQRPSQLLCEMEGLNAGQISKEALRTIWLQRLPHNVRQILSVCSDEISDLDKLAKIADKVYEGSGGAVASAGFSKHVSRSDKVGTKSVKNNEEIDPLNALRHEIAALRNEVRDLRSGASTSTDRPSVRNFRRNRSRSSSNTRKNFCWYHFKFGKKASKCIKPCNWVSEN